MKGDPMYIKRYLAPLLFINLFIMIGLTGQTPNNPLEGFGEFINQVIRDWRTPGMAVAIIKDGTVIFGEGFGYRDIERKLPVTSQSLFAIASCSKAFTTTAIAMLVEDGLLRWDAPVRDFLHDFRTSDSYITEHITVRDLVTHRSGLPRHDRVWIGTPFSREELVEKIQYLDFSRGFRESYQYNNLMFVTAGRVIEAVSGTSWENFVNLRILRPLGMVSTNFSVTDMQSFDDYARSYTISDNGLHIAPMRNVDALGPAGSINSNINDMARWVQFNLNRGIVMLDTLISPSHLTQLHSPWVIATRESDDEEFSYASYGLGWRVSMYKGERIVYHAGAIGAYRAYIMLLPDHNIGIVSLTNYNRAQVNQVVTFNAIERLLNLERTDWSTRLKERISEPREDPCHPSPRLTHPLDAYAGTYEHPAYGELSITRNGRRLSVTRYGETSNLEHCKFNMFRRERGYWGAFGSRLRFTFMVNDDDEIDRVLIPLESAVDDIVFTRIR
jgi:CubicO group peptidase (beta-lactamase class C family)